MRAERIAEEGPAPPPAAWVLGRGGPAQGAPAPIQPVFRVRGDFWAGK